ncbi:MAG: proprotein convertase P-domain-containing protein [Phycisphaerae bacterium]|nr:proprotein convertase P-domain-containing protein [Phycisphaerae bacterium]
MKARNAMLCLALLVTSAAGAATTNLWSGDVPKAIPDNDVAGTESVLSGPQVIVSDINLLLSNVTHTGVADLRIELVSPDATTAVLVRAWNEGGILESLGCPDHFLGTVLDDEAATNLRDGTAPYTGSFNIEHASVAVHPFSNFVGKVADGTWRLRVSDRASGDAGTLVKWGIQFSGQPFPHMGSVGFGGGAMALSLGDLETGVTYAVERALDLGGTNTWTAVTNLVFTSPDAVWTNTLSGDAAWSFYRLRKQ